jgi:hypothetical protein
VFVGIWWAPLIEHELNGLVLACANALASVIELKTVTPDRARPRQ